jgi:hypothetical protein
VVIAFGIRVEGEGFDSADPSPPWGQDAVIDAVAAANRNTIVVLETGNPVSMTWRNNVKAIVQAWYPGQAGAQAIAGVLSGAVNPSGRLPITADVELRDHDRSVALPISQCVSIGARSLDSLLSAIGEPFDRSAGRRPGLNSAIWAWSVSSRYLGASSSILTMPSVV